MKFLTYILIFISFTYSLKVRGQSISQDINVSEIIKTFNIDTNVYLLRSIRSKLSLSDFNKVNVSCSSWSEMEKEKTETVLSIRAIFKTSISNNKVFIDGGLIKKEMYSYYYDCNIDISEGYRKSSVKWHEQIHFDILEVYIRLYRKRFIENLSVISDSSDAEVILSRVVPIKEMFQKQAEYDDEVKHNGTFQANFKYHSWIAQKLKELEAYANPVIYF